MLFVFWLQLGYLFNVFNMCSMCSMCSMHLFGYQIEFTDIGDAGHHSSALITPNDRLQRTGHHFLGGSYGKSLNFHNLITLFCMSCTSVGANLQKFGLGKVQPFQNIMKKFRRSSFRFGNLPACTVDVHSSMKVVKGAT